MNIIVKPHGAEAAICRPDTTWERENKDIYIPEDIDGLSYAPVLFARISKAGKCVGARFAARYYDAVNYGVLLYPTSLLGTGHGFAAASCTDHTSILPSPLYNICVLESGDNTFRLFKDNEEIYSTACGNTTVIEEAIVSASKHISLRIGDMVCIELAPTSDLIPSAGKETSDRQSVTTELHAAFCDNETFRLKLIR